MTKMYVDQNQTVTGLNQFSGNTQYFYNGIAFEATGNIYIISSGNDMIFRDISLGTTKTLSQLAAGGFANPATTNLDMNGYSIYGINKLAIGSSGVPSYEIYVPAGTIYAWKILCAPSSVADARFRLPVGNNLYG